MQNILVDEAGEITAIIDWECVSAVPLWRACQLPECLNSQTRDEQPKKEEYAPDTGAENSEAVSTVILDNEGIADLY